MRDGDAARARRDERPRARHRRQRARRRAARRLSRHARLALAAGRTGRAPRQRGARRAGRPRRPARHLPRPPPARPSSAGRSRRPCSTPTTLTCSSPHLECAASELPLHGSRSGALRPVAPGCRRRPRAPRAACARAPGGWFWTARVSGPGCDLRGTGGAPVAVVEEATGRLLGTVDRASAHTHVHPGALYLHQGEAFVVRTTWTRADGSALVEPRRRGLDDDRARRSPTLRVVRGAAAPHRRASSTVCFGTVDVTSQVVGYLRRRIATGEVLGEEPLDLPPRELRTRAVWYVVPGRRCSPAADSREADVPGCRPRRRARGDRPAPAVGDLRPLGHRRRLDRAAPGHRRGHRLRLRRRARRRGLRRARLPARRRLARRDEDGDRRLRVRARAARRAFSRPSAATATTRSTRPGPRGCSPRCSQRSAVTDHLAVRREPPPERAPAGRR